MRRGRESGARLLTADKLAAVARSLSEALATLAFEPPVTHVYNPLEYAWKPHRAYLERYANGPKEVVLLGMNPGPYGMAQTGVPFGEIEHVRDWLGIHEEVETPLVQHPRRPIEGFACRRSEVSGRRLWSFAKHKFGSPGSFFCRFMVLNYCPLVFMEETGRNRTPDKLPASERRALFAHCDAALRTAVEAIRPAHVVGVGAFAERRAREALAGLGIGFGRVLHPSPASPEANRGWAERATQDLEALGIVLP